MSFSLFYHYINVKHHLNNEKQNNHKNGEQIKQDSGLNNNNLKEEKQ